MVNLGTSHGLASFHYPDDGLKTYNLALSGEDIYHDFQTLKQFSNHLSKGCIVALVVSYFSFCMSTEEPSQKRYYSYLDKEYIRDFSYETLISAKYVPVLRSGEFIIKDLIKDQNLDVGAAMMNDSTSTQANENNNSLLIQYASMADLLRELQLPKQRGRDIKEQLECFSNAAFSFDWKIVERQQGVLFENLYEDGNYPKGDVTVTTRSTGNIRFTNGVQFKEIDDGTGDNKYGKFKIILSPEFSSFCQAHAVPIDYGVYKSIESASGKDLYAWLVYRNNGLKEPTFIPRAKLVEQFMPVTEKQDKNTVNVNYAFIINQIKEIKKKIDFQREYLPG